MNAATLQHDAFMPRRPRGLGLGLVLALIAHVLLVIALAFGVNWRSHEPQGLEAELWSATPQAAAPRAAEPEPQPKPPEPKPPQPEARRPGPAPEPKPVQPPAPDPQIAIEKAKREQAKKDQLREEQEEREQAKKEQAKRDKAEQLKKEQAKREEAERAKDEQDRKKQLAEKDRADAAKLAAAREANLKRMMGQAGATGGPTATGTAARSSGPSPGYAGRIAALVKRNIAYQLQPGAAPAATVEVRVASDGTIIGMRLTKSSGDKLYDDAVLRAIDKTGTFPRDINGTIPSPMELVFRAND